MGEREEVTPMVWDANEYQGRSPERISSSYKTGAMAFVIVLTFLLGWALSEVLFWLHGLLK
jgi:hypothetical protein